MKRERKKPVTWIPLYKERRVCFFCGQVLDDKGQMNVCTSAGVMILTCGDHATRGDWMINMIRFTYSERE